MPTNPDDEIAVFVPPEAVFPDLRADETGLFELLRGLSRTDNIFSSARVNLIVAGAGDATPKERQQRALSLLGAPDVIRGINDFAEGAGGVDRKRVFFCGQLLELIRRVSEFSTDHPPDGETFNDPGVAKAFRSGRSRRCGALE